MDEIFSILSAITSSNEVIQNSNAVIGHELQRVISILELDPKSADNVTNFEETLFSLISSKNIHLSSVVSNTLGMLLTLYYRNHKISHWNFITVINDAISRSSIAGVVVLGMVSRHCTEGIKSQLPSLINTMLQIQTNSMQPFICQCFRRILKGTGTFLTKSIGDVFNYVSKNMSNPSVNSMKIECFRTISTLFVFSKVSREKILPLLGQMLSCATSYTHRYAAAKTLATIGFEGCSKDVELSQNTKGENIDPFQFFFRIILDLSPRDSSVATISSSFVIFLKFFDPIFVIENLKYLLNFVIDFTSQKYVSLTSLAVLAVSVFNAVVRLAGESISTSICNLILEKLKDKQPTGGFSTVALTLLIHFTFMSKLPSSALASITMYAYPFLSTTRSDIRRLSAAYFAVLAQKDPSLSSKYYRTFVDFFGNLAKAKEHEVDGFSRAVVYNVVYSKVDENELLKICISMLKNNTFPHYSFLILASLLKRHFVIQKPELLEIFSHCEKCSKSAKGMKFVSLFIYQVVLLKLNEKHNELNQFIIQYVQSFLQNSRSLKCSSPTYLTFLNIARESNSILKKTPSISSSISNLCIVLINEYISTDIADQLHPFSGQIDQIFDLYNVRIPSTSTTLLDSTAQTIYQVLLDYQNNYSNRFNLIKEINNSFSTWFLLSENNNKMASITNIFAQSKNAESNLGKMVLIRLLLGRPKLAQYLPNNGLPFILNFEASNNRVLQRYAAATAAKWLKLHPELMDACFEYLEKPTRSVTFSCNLFSELSKGLSDPSRCLLILMSIMKKQPLTFPLFAISSFLKNCGKQINDNLNLNTMIISILNKSAFSDCLRNPSAMYFYKCCFFHLRSVHPSVVFSLMNFPVFRNFAYLQGLELLKIVNPNECFEFKANLIKFKSHESYDNSSQAIEKPTDNTAIEINYSGLIDGLLLKSVFSSDHLPHMILAQLYKYADTIDDVPGMFMLLQQTHLSTVGESLLKSVNKFPDLKFWTDMCKRVVLNKCVPPAERKNEIRVLPTRVVLILAMKVVVKLVNKIRELFPLELNCVDDIVSIAFNSVQINDRKVDFHSFSILSAVLRAFIDVRNRDGALLNTYLSQFHPMLRHALDGTRAITNVAGFVIAYLNFLAESENQLLEEAINITQKGISKTESLILSMLKTKKDSLNIETFVTFCRIKTRLLTLTSTNDNNEDNESMKEIVLEMIDLVCQKKVCLIDLEDELVDFVSISLPLISDDVRHLLYLLLIYELSKPKCPLSVLNSIAIQLDNCIKNNNSISTEELEYTISSVSQNKDFFVSSLDNDNNTQLFDDTDSLDTNFYWISKMSSKSSLIKKYNYLCFLTKISQLIPINEKDLWKSIFSLSIECRPICFSSLSVLLFKLKKADTNSKNEFIDFIYNSLHILLTSENCIPFCTQLFDKEFLDVNYVNEILKLVSNEISNDFIMRKFEVFRSALIHFGDFDLSCLNDICKIIVKEGNLVPNGINFIASLLVDKRTVKSGLNILFNGVVDAIALSIPSSLNSLPRILHFFDLAMLKSREVCSSNNFDENFEAFQKSLISIVFFAMKFSKNQKGKEAVIQPAVSIVKKINPEFIKEKFEMDSRKGELIQAVQPPKVRKAAVIELKTFGVVKPSSANKWQTLEIADDDDL